jgi:hypothetical protein
MNTILLAIIAALLVVITGFLISLILELKKTVVCMRNTTEMNLNPALEELQLTLKSIRHVAYNVNVITEDVKGIADSISQVSSKLYAFSGLIDVLGSSVSGRAVGLKAGVTTALTYFITNLFKKGDTE